MSRTIDVISLIGAKKLRESYELCMEVYGDGFDSRMASMSLEIIDLQDKSGRPGGIHFNESAFYMLITDDDKDFSKEEHERMNHEIRSAILWNALEKPEMVKEIENLKKVLGDLRGG